LSLRPRKESEFFKLKKVYAVHGKEKARRVKKSPYPSGDKKVGLTGGRRGKSKGLARLVGPESCKDQAPGLLTESSIEIFTKKKQGIPADERKQER